MLRTVTLVFAAALAVAACSGGGDEPTVAPTATPAATSPADTVAVADQPSDDAGDDAALSDVVPQWSVTIDVVAEGFEGEPIDTSVGWTGDPNAVVEDGPFGSFGSCSGLRERVSGYSVFVSGSDSLDLVGIWTADRVAGAGIFDAEVRVEREGADPLTANGTITILDDLQRGQFLAFGPDGGRVEGSFSCSGAEPAAPMRSDDAVTDSVEVFAVLRDGDTERIVGLAIDSSGDVTCATDGGSEIVVGVDDDASVGAITAFELGGGPTGALLRVAGVAYEFPVVDLTIDEAGTSGFFSGANLDGTSVDGAFRCG
ncbi:MAG TPA: hypothetical protein VK917_05210 [Ilumatobacter sp.]|nr:hypothetical protein [Ilumatobacter sp.]